MNKTIRTDKRGGFTDLFIFMIVAFIVVVMSAIFIYMGVTVQDKLEETLPSMGLVGDGNNNVSVVIENSMGVTNEAFKALYWISIFLIFGMIIAIFIGSYMVTTKPIFFIPYIFIVIIAVIVAVGISNAYELLFANATLNSTFANFVGSNWILAKLPIIVSIVGMVGGIIMFVRMGKRDDGGYYGQ